MSFQKAFQRSRNENATVIMTYYSTEHNISSFKITAFSPEPSEVPRNHHKKKNFPSWALPDFPL